MFRWKNICVAMGRLAGFASTTRGNVAMTVAFSIIPLTIAIGGGVDLTRTMVVRSNLASALDAAGLAVGATSGLTLAQMQTLAQQYFTANYTTPVGYGVPNPVTLIPAITGSGSVTNTVTVSTSVSVPTVFMRIVGINTVHVGYTSKVTWGQTKLWVALVLDNTLSMAETDINGVSKISALKTATNQLLTMLKNASANPGDVQVALVPFSKNVQLPASMGTSGIDFTDFLSAPPNSMPSALVGPGSLCPYVQNVVGYGCTSGPANGSAAVTTIPSSGTYKGYICPGMDMGVNGTNYVGPFLHFYNGCYNSVAGLLGLVYTHTWIPNSTSTWDRCVMDRSQDYDVSDTTPTGTATDFPAENNYSCPPAALMGLNYNWTSLTTEVNAMTPNGSTDQPIGLAWGWQAMTQGAPFNPPALPPYTSRIIILLSDGLNTQDRWYTGTYEPPPEYLAQDTDVDARMTLVCNAAKADGVTIYTIYVDLNGTQGSSTVLQNCASDPSKYFDLTTSGQIVTTLNEIGTQITQLRVAL
ncbi:MAG: pilus assembly protein TadG-related protein [Rhizomicrobium sp.]